MITALYCMLCVLFSSLQQKSSNAVEYTKEKGKHAMQYGSAIIEVGKDTIQEALTPRQVEKQDGPFGRNPEQVQDRLLTESDMEDRQLDLDDWLDDQTFFVKSPCNARS